MTQLCKLNVAPECSTRHPTRKRPVNLLANRAFSLSNLERDTRFELATSTLARFQSPANRERNHVVSGACGGGRVQERPGLTGGVRQFVAPDVAPRGRS